VSLVDLFLRCDPSDALSKLKAVYEACQCVAMSLSQGEGHKNMLVTRTSCTVTMFVSNNQQIPPVQVVLQVVESVPDLLRRFDVDCAAIGFEPATGKAWMTTRAKRAFESGCNMLDSRFNSSAYTGRLWKYACRGFAVAVPGLDLQAVSPNIARDNYVYVENKDVLLRIDKVGRFGRDHMNVEFNGKRAAMVYVRCDEASRVDGLLKLVVMDRCAANGNVRIVSLPVIKECVKCKVQTVEPALSTDSPLLLHTGLPRKYHLIWGADLSNNVIGDFAGSLDDACDAEVTEDVAGYACTPLARAYDLFDHLLEMQLLEEDASAHSKFGIVARLSAKMNQQNGEVAAAMCRRHYDRVLSSKGRVGFAWDLMNANVDGFYSLKTIFDAGVVPSLESAAKLPDDTFERTYGFPRCLQFKRAELRIPTTIDWYREVY
jgi:hypothetical protein